MPTETQKSRIAVIGLACWYPGARNARELWENILSKRRQFRRIPDCRMPMSDYHHPDPGHPDTTYAMQAALIDGFEFDWRRRRIPRSTFQSADISHWLALEVALEAIADAGYTRQTIPHDVSGVIIGNTLTGEQTRSNNLRLRWPYVRRAFQSAAKSVGLNDIVAGGIEPAFEHYYKSVFPAVNEDTLAGGLSNTIAGWICNYLDLYGGGYTVDGACSSSLLAIATAATALASGNLDLALAGGVDISLDPFELVGFSKTGALARKEMRVYDRRGDGFVPGEGCGMVVLKRLEDALKDKNHVYAVLHGWAISSDGSGSGITAPNVKGQSKAILRAYAQASYSLRDIDFIEGHGTGTSVGDRVELEALRLALRKSSDSTGTSGRPCGVTSLKSIIGHTKAASGVGGFIKALMAVNRRVVPPLAGCDEPHAAFTGNVARLVPIIEGEIHKPAETIRAGVSAMGFGGINCHVTIESGDPPSPRLEPAISERALLASSQQTEIFPLTANSEHELKQKAKALVSAVKGISLAELTDLAAKLGNEANPAVAIRAAIIANHIEDLTTGLDQLLVMIEKTPPIEGEISHSPEKRVWLGNRANRSRVAMLLPGQGSQKINMARVLVDRFPWARKLVDEADICLGKIQTGPISNLIYRSLDRADPGEVNAWFKNLSRPEIAQPAICLASLVWYQFLQKLGITPVAVGGHGLGELTAFHIAGAFDVSTLLHLAGIRGQVIAAADQKAASLVSLNSTMEEAEEICSHFSGHTQLANINGPRKIVSGEKAAIKNTINLVSGPGIHACRQAASNAFHTRLMSDAAECLKAEGLLPANLPETTMRLFSGVGGQEVQPGIALGSHFATQIQARVEFEAMIESMAAACDIFVEVGPGRALSHLVNATGVRSPVCLPVESQPFCDEDLNALLALLFVQGVEIHWNVLYEGRLIREFMFPSERLFIENPCERPFDLETSAPISTVPDNLIEFLPGLASISREELSEYLQSRGTFISQVIQADMEYLKQKEFQAQGKKIVLSNPSKASGATGSTATGSRIDNEILLFSLIEELTGFPRESLNLEMRLLDDLNLDSIKAGDLLVKAIKATAFEGNIEPLDYANATLKEILDELTGPDNKAASAPSNTEPDTLAILREQAARIMQVPETSIDPNALLGPELGMGLAESKQLLRCTAPLLNVESTIDPLPVLRRSLLQLAEIFNRLAPKPGPDYTFFEKLELDPWVREFAVDLAAKTLPGCDELWGNRQEDDWHTANVLVLKGPENERISNALCNAFEGHGANVNAASFEEARDQSLAVDISYTHLVAILPRIPGPEAANDAYLHNIVEYLASLTLSPSASEAPRRRTTITYVQFGGGNFGSRLQFTGMNPCCATALCKSMHLERSDLRVRVLDFFPFSDPEKIAVKVIEEMSTPESFSATGYDSKFRRRVPLLRLMEPASYKPRTSLWSAEDVILVTGGAKGITARCAFAVAQVTGARMALLGRATHPGKKPRDKGEKEIEANLVRYSESGLVARYFSCDVTDLEALASLIQRIQKEMGPITGVIHGAGLNHPNPANRVSVKQAIQEVSPKVIGAMNLLYLLEEAPPKIFIGLGSVIGITGMPGNAWYGFSNETLDVILRRFELDHPTTQVLTVAFSIWRDEGMGARMGSVTHLRRIGVHAIPTEEGVKRFVRLYLNDPGVRQVIVTGRLGGLDTWEMDHFPDLPGARFLEQPLLITPGVESVFLARLSFEKDPYLKDHCFNGSCLFPTVFGLEAMAQVVAHVTGDRDFSRVKIKDIRLERPITVDADGAEIVLWAQAAELDPESNVRVVRAGMVKLHTGIKSDFFSASFVIGLTDKSPTTVIDCPPKPLDICPETDLYRDNFLFHGSRFQKIEKIWKLSGQGETTASALFSARQGTLPQDQETDPCTLLLGDPFCRDTLLQSAQLLVPKVSCLPVGITSLEIYPTGKKTLDSVFVSARLDKVEGKKIYATVIAVDNDGCIKEKLEGYCLNILKEMQDNPSLSDLLVPDDRDNSILNRLVQNIGALMQLKLPNMLLTYVPGIHDLPKEGRRKVEIPALEHVVHQALGSCTSGSQNLKFSWLDSGKPIVVDLPGNNLGLSVAHDDRLCLFVAGSGPQGCDIAPITKRTREEWRALLSKRGDGLLDALLHNNASIDREGTRVWAAMEAFRKRTDGKGELTETVQKHGDHILFRGTSADGQVLVLTLALNLTWGPEKIIAVTVHQDFIRKNVQSEKPTFLHYEGYGDLDTHHYEITEGGPQGQDIFVHRLPIGFRPNAQLSRTVYFSNYVFWAGEIREASMWPILREVGSQFSSGKYGTVTNSTHLIISGNATVQDQIEIRLWASGNGGPANSTMQLTYDFRKILPNGFERLAWCEQEVTWVHIMEHGIVKPEPYPDYYWNFMKSMLPVYDAPNLPNPLPEPLAPLRSAEGDTLRYRSHEGPIVRPLLSAQKIETSLDDSNLVGNIYFAHYYAWMGRTRDRFFFSLIPQYFRGTAKDGELLCLECRVHHLREAMPFDRIEVTMALKELHTFSIVLYFEYFRIEDNGKRTKLAFGEQLAIWTIQDAGGKILPAPFPDPVMEAFNQAISTQ